MRTRPPLNAVLAAVYRSAMRPPTARATCSCLLLLFLFRASGLHAQPSPPDISFTLAESRHVLRPFTRPHRVELVARMMPDNDADRRTPGTWSEHVIAPYPLYADTAIGWVVYGPYECWCRDLQMRVIAGADTMVLLFPDGFAERWKLVERVMQRSRQFASPEVIRFRPGRFAFAEVIDDPDALVLARSIADRLMRDRIRRGHRILAEEGVLLPSPVQPPPAPPPPPVMTQERFDSIAATWGGLEKVGVERTVQSRDSLVWVHISGTITLDGGCASGMPLFGIEQRVGKVWRTRVPMPEEQMDCGMSRATWADRRVGFDLPFWTSHGRQSGGKELLPGTYRLVFMGGDLKELRTHAFSLQ